MIDWSPGIGEVKPSRSRSTPSDTQEYPLVDVPSQWFSPPRYLLDPHGAGPGSVHGVAIPILSQDALRRLPRGRCHAPPNRGATASAMG